MSDVNYSPTLEPYVSVSPFKAWCQKVIPAVYDGSISIYEMLCKLTAYINQIIDNMDGQQTDITNLLNAYNQLQEYVSTYFDDLNVQDEINNKLDELIKNGTFTQLLKDYLPFITLSMFGANEDGITDDSDYLQSALNLSSETGIAVYLKGSIAIGKTITIPDNAKLYSFNTNISPSINVLEGVSEAFICDSSNVCISGVCVKPISKVYSEITAFKFNNINSDVILKNVTVLYCNTAIYAASRNVRITDCMFSHCRVGVYFDLTSGSQYRGLSVENNRFHGIGEELALGWFENSSCIVISNDNTGNITIRNNTVEQSGTFITGFMSNMLIEGNMCECYAKPIIVITSDTPVTPSNTGVIAIIGNYLTGKRGSITPSYISDYPENIIVVKNVYRVQIISNILKFSTDDLLNIENSNGVQINGNIFNSGNLNNTIKSAILMKNCEASIQNNNAIGVTQMFNDDSSGHLFNYTGNYLPLNVDTIILSYSDTWYPLGSCSANSPLSFSLSKTFMVSVRGQNINFYCVRNGDYYSGGAYLVDNAHLMLLSFLVNGENVTPLINVFELPTMTRTPKSYTLDFYKITQ